MEENKYLIEILKEESNLETYLNFLVEKKSHVSLFNFT